MDNFDKLLKVFELAPRFLATIAIVSGFLLWSSQTVIESLGLSQFRADHRQWIGISLLLSIGGLAATGFGLLWQLASRRRAHVALINRLKDLTEEEKQVLRWFLEHNTRTSQLKYGNGVVQGLIAAGIIIHTNPQAYRHHSEACLIAEDALGVLKKRPDLLTGSTTTVVGY